MTYVLDKVDLSIVNGERGVGKLSWNFHAFYFFLKRLIGQPSLKLGSWHLELLCCARADHGRESRYVAPRFHEISPWTFVNHPLGMTLLLHNQDHQRTLPGPSYGASPLAQSQGR